MEVKVRLSPTCLSACNRLPDWGSGLGHAGPLCIPNQEAASGFSWFSTPSHPRTPGNPPTHPSLAFPHTRDAPMADLHILCPSQLAGRRHFRDCVTHPPFFLCSLAMRSSSWHGPSGRARRQSRRGWRGCGGRSRKTWSWPLRSARPTCPLPRCGPALKCPEAGWPGVGHAAGEDVEIPTYTHTLALGDPQVIATVTSRTCWSESPGHWMPHPGRGDTVHPSRGRPEERPRTHLFAVTPPPPSWNWQAKHGASRGSACLLTLTRCSHPGTPSRCLPDSPIRQTPW